MIAVRSLSLAVLLAVLGANAQSACLLQCLTTGEAATACPDYTSTDCVCSSTAFQSAAQTCLMSNCTAEDQAAAVALQSQICGAGSSAASAASSVASAISSIEASATSVASSVEASITSAASSVLSSASSAIASQSSSLSTRVNSATSTAASPTNSPNAGQKATGSIWGVAAVAAVAGGAMLF